MMLLLNVFKHLWKNTSVCPLIILVLAVRLCSFITYKLPSISSIFIVKKQQCVLFREFDIGKCVCQFADFWTVNPATTTCSYQFLRWLDRRRLQTNFVPSVRLCQFYGFKILYYTKIIIIVLLVLNKFSFIFQHFAII